MGRAAKTVARWKSRKAGVRALRYTISVHHTEVSCSLSVVSCKLPRPWVVPYTLLMPIMKAVELQGEIDDQHRLHADVPQSLPAGSVRVIVLISEEDEGGSAWAAGVSSEWSAEPNDPAQDIYTLNDGQPIDAFR
ncbi:MAG: hypothetical protein ABSF71_33170 [Terriglobia bacterium]|jgi:hypothetical protein